MGRKWRKVSKTAHAVAILTTRSNDNNDEDENDDDQDGGDDKEDDEDKEEDVEVPCLALPERNPYNHNT